MNDDDIEQWPSRAVDCAMQTGDFIDRWRLPPHERALVYRMLGVFMGLDYQAKESENENWRRVSK